MKKQLLATAFAWLLAFSQVHAQTIDSLGNAGALTGTEKVPMFQTANPAVAATAQAIANLAASVTINAQTGTTYTVADGDRGKLVTYSNGSAIGVTLPQAGAASAFLSGWYSTHSNLGAGTVTITPATSTIDGAASITLLTSESISIVSDGTNYFTARGRVPSFLQAATQGGNTTKIGTISGSLTSGNFVKADSSGNLVDGASQFCGHPTYAASRFYNLWPNQAGAGAAQTANTVYFYPFCVAGSVSFTSFNVWVTTGVALSKFMAGVYADVAGLPSGSATCVPSGDAATASSAAVATVTVSCTLTQGWYWIGINVSGATTMLAIQGTAATAADIYASWLIGVDTASNALGGGTASSVKPRCLSAASNESSGTMPAAGGLSFGFDNTGGTCPLVAAGT